MDINNLDEEHLNRLIDKELYLEIVAILDGNKTLTREVLQEGILWFLLHYNTNKVEQIDYIIQRIIRKLELEHIELEYFDETKYKNMRKNIEDMIL